MGAIGSRPAASEEAIRTLSPVDFYNRLQDTRALVLTVLEQAEDSETTQEEWDDHSELRFLSPALFRKGIEVLATRPARGWSVVVIGRKNHGGCRAQDLRTWLCRRGFSGRPGALVESVERLSCSLEEFYSQFPFLEPGNPDFELVRLYPSLMALVGAETRLFLSNWGVASDPHTYNALGIKYVVNCSPELPFVDEVVNVQGLGTVDQQPLGVEGLQGPFLQQPIHAQLRVKLAGRLRVPVQDGADQRICDHFLESVEFLEKSVGAQSGHILIHCKHGQSRSATVLAAFMLHVAKQMGTPKTAEEVLVQLRGCRPRVRPNLGFLRQLQDFAGELKRV